MARFKDGGFHWDYMTVKEVEAIRDKGNGKNNPVWKDYFTEMGKKTAIRRIAKFLPMSVQRAAMVEDLVDAGKKFSTDQLGEIIIESDEGVIEGTAQAVDEKTNAGKLDEFAGGAPGKESPPQSTGPKLEDFLEDIANSTHFEGLRYKSDQALAAFPAAKAQEAINKAISERQAALTEDVGKRAAAEPGASARKLFQPKDKPEGEAA
jgi:hypothetical protein